MKKIYLVIALSLIVLASVVYMRTVRVSRLEPQVALVGARSYKDATYSIDGKLVTLVSGVAEAETAQGRASKTITRYFGNDLSVDLNNDGKLDVVFLLTQQTGGSGTFYYAVSAIQTDHGYIGSDGYLLGDRVAPQAITMSQNPTQQNVVVVNYVERRAGEPMTTPPSVGKSVYLKLDVATMQWGVVVPNFEGEAR